MSRACLCAVPSRCNHTAIGLVACRADVYVTLMVQDDDDKAPKATLETKDDDEDDEKDEL